MSAPPIWLEARGGLELAALLRDPVWRGAGVPDGGGRPVLLIPGFLAGDQSLLVLARWLRKNHYRPLSAGIAANRGCAERMVERLEARLEPGTTIIGQSRGGVFARVLGVRRPDLVTHVVALGSPLLDQLAVHPFVHGVVRQIAALGDRGIGGMFSTECGDGACCERFRADLAAPFPESVGFTVVYSRSDGIVDWRACLDPAARHVEVTSSHAGMNAHPAVYRVLAETL